MSLRGAHYILACDPGLSGQFCLFDVNTLEAKFYPLPTKQAAYFYKDKTGAERKKKYRVIDAEALTKLVNELAQPSVLFVVLEYQQCFPGQGAVSTARIIGIYNLLEGMFRMTRLSLEIVRPVVWKRALHLIKNNCKDSRYQKKNKAWLLAIKLFPNLRPTLVPKTKCFDKSDSLLMCEYARRNILRKYLPGYRVAQTTDPSRTSATR
jgi:hypothetical protein